MWFAFNEDQFRRQGHTGKWLGKLIRTWKTGTDGEMTKACFRLSDGQDVTVVLEEEEYMDTPEQHEGYCDPENLCSDELRFLGLDELVPAARGARAKKAAKVASPKTPPAKASKKRKAPSRSTDPILAAHGKVAAEGNLPRLHGTTVRKTRGNPVFDANLPVETVQGLRVGLPRVDAGAQDNDGTLGDSVDTQSEPKSDQAEPATPPRSHLPKPLYRLYPMPPCRTLFRRSLTSLHHRRALRKGHKTHRRLPYLLDLRSLPAWSSSRRPHPTHQPPARQQRAPPGGRRARLPTRPPRLQSQTGS